MSWKVGFPNDA
jgi:hypothetical protein